MLVAEIGPLVRSPRRSHAQSWGEVRWKLNPLILHKKNRSGTVASDPSDSEWVQEVTRRCRLAKETLARTPLDKDPCQHVRTLIYEDLPALLEKLERS